MKNISNITLLLSSAALAGAMLAACAPENPRLMSPPVKYGVAETEAKPQVLNVTPKVDILLVIDNSDSMVDEQETLSKNIDKFANGLAKSGNIDFHIGATAIWDTRLFAGMTKEYQNGELRRLKTPDGKENMPDSFGRFVDSKVDYDSYLASRGFDLKKQPGWLQVLSASMKIGVEKYDKNYATSGKSGAEIEEIFSPVKAALSEPVRSAANNGFRRKDAHFVIIFITDTDATVKHKEDGVSTDLTGGELEDFLRAEMGEGYRDQTTVLGALAKSTDAEKERDPSIRYARLGPTEPVNILSFIRNLGGKHMGLRGSSYGTEMANLGAYVRSRALSKPRVDFEKYPEWGTIEVLLNGEKLVLGESWLYDTDRNSVIITRDLSGVKGALDIKVNYTPVIAGSVGAGRLTTPSQMRQ